ncbi:MAG: glutaredoxin family protein [Euryarchaeota archaeon]|nr:glutaredoxin family protein [Euryarchaeota archaeon]MDP3106125.1 glutaredoxin domain-containing protein [Candidatus Methanoperedens sp.]
MQEIQLYSTTNCPNCRVLKQFFETRNIQYKEVNMATPAALTELRMNNVFTMSAPVLQIGSRFFTTKELFSQEKIDQSRLESFLKN